MIRRTFIALCIVTLAVAGAVADDGEINNKNMSRTIQLPTYSMVPSHVVPEEEHVFPDMM